MYLTNKKKGKKKEIQISKKILRTNQQIDLKKKKEEKEKWEKQLGPTLQQIETSTLQIGRTIQHTYLKKEFKK